MTRSFVLLLSPGMAFWFVPSVVSGDEGMEFFESKIRPALVKHCYECHSAEAEKSKGDLLLDSAEAMRRGGATGPAVVPGDLSASLLIEAIRYEDEDYAMPPEKSGGKLPEEVIADFEKWIAMGAPDPRSEVAPPAKSYDAEAAKNWWSYQPLANPPIPAAAGDGWARTDIDRFIAAGYLENDLRPVADADKSSLLRRLFIDLIGLPPSTDFLAKFEASDDPAVYERIVDWLLASEHFGERWGRRWLDVARYAETTGRDVNVTLTEAWRYRDYVIDSFNEDKPFDQFIREQIAGDLLPAADEADRAEKLIATGFLAIGPKGLNQIDPRQFAVDLADEQIDTATQAFLGMTVSCARCHDHKFDPISQRDYTALAGIFLSSETKFGTPGGVRARNASDLIVVGAAAGLATPGRSMDAETWAQKNAELETVSTRRDEALRSRRGGGDGSMSGFDIVRMMTRAQQLETELAAFLPDGSAKPRVMGVVEKPTTIPDSERRRGPGVGGPNAQGRTGSGFEVIGDSPFFARGDIEKEEETVPRGVPEFLAGGRTLDIPAEASGRLELANWIASDRNTLAARVAVNRVWHWLFGKGLVESVDNFGASGREPSHPELLDHLARQFMADGWSTKTLIKRIVTSRVYALGSHHAESNFEIDPENQLLWRANSRRLDAETIRDSMLFVSGRLETESPDGSLIAEAGDGPIGGDRFRVLSEEQIEQANGVHRSVYLPIARNVQPAVLSVFDFSEPSIVLGARDTTIVPPQTLYLMNGDFVHEQATAFAERVMVEKGFDRRFSLACRLAWCREPLPEEASAARALDRGDLASWTSICRALLASAEFLFVN